MEYNVFCLGKVRKIDHEHGLGEVVALNKSYFFVLDNDNDNLVEGDIVSFRAERVQDVDKAFFVNKLTNLKNTGIKLKCKTYNPKGNE